MGDNLKAASRFVYQSISSLDHITSSGPLSQDSVLDKLSDLQRGAKAMRARAIYRAAQSAVDMVHKGQAEDKVHSELHIVRALVVQYQHGLQEILGAEDDLRAEMVPPPQDAQAIQAETINAGASAPMLACAAKPSLLDDMMMPLDEANETDEAGVAQTIDDKTAVDTTVEDGIKASENTDIYGDELSQNIMPLVQFAPEAKQRDALRRLSVLHSDFTGHSQRVARHERLDMSAKPALRRAAKPMQMISFESFMPELTNIVLTTARHLEKTVSISYSALGVDLNVDLANKLRLALSDLSVLLVTQSLEAPQVRRRRGESGAGHISIMASVKLGELSLNIESTGRDITAQDLETASWKQLEALGAILKISRDDNRLCLGINGLHVKALPQKPAQMPMLEHAS